MSWVNLAEVSPALRKCHLVCVFVTLLVACQPMAPVVSPPPDADAAIAPPGPLGDAQLVCPFPQTLCGQACRNVTKFGCPNSTVKGLCCSDWLCNVPSYESDTPERQALLSCLVGASSNVDMRNCGLVCP